MVHRTSGPNRAPVRALFPPGHHAMDPQRNKSPESPVQPKHQSGATAIEFAFVLPLLIALTPFLSPSRRDLFPIDETRYSEVVREMGGEEQKAGVYFPFSTGKVFDKAAATSKHHRNRRPLSLIL